MATDFGFIALGALFATVAFGAVIPVVPTGAAVSAAAVIIKADEPWEIILVVIAGAAGAYLGDIITYGALRSAGTPLARRLGWLDDDDPNLASNTLARLRARIESHEIRTLLLSRLIPGGRVPVLLAASLGGYSWRRFAAAAPIAATLWALVYAMVGVAGGIVFHSKTDALIAAVIGALAFTAIAKLVQRRRAN